MRKREDGEGAAKVKLGRSPTTGEFSAFISSAASELQVHLTQPPTSRAAHFNTFILLSHRGRADVKLGFMSDVISGIIDV